MADISDCGDISFFNKKSTGCRMKQGGTTRNSSLEKQVENCFSRDFLFMAIGRRKQENEKITCLQENSQYRK